MESIMITEFNNQSFPVGSVISSRLSSHAVGNLIQVHECLDRFKQVLGIQEELPFEEIVNELLCSWPENLGSSQEDSHDLSNKLCVYGDKLTAIHRALFPKVVSNLLKKIFSVKKISSVKEMKNVVLDTLPINELTWPELVRKYIIAYLIAGGGDYSVEIDDSKRTNIIRCMYGEGGICCGSPTGVAAVDLDSQMLGKAVDKIFGKRSVLFKGITGTNGETSDYSIGGIPEWAKVLDPVRKLPTNVGSRIRNCVYEALKRSPPEWAKKELEASIAKDLYKGNASGPTKKAVIAVLDKVCDGALRAVPVERVENNTNAYISDYITRKCRIVLRNVANNDINKVFCDLVGDKDVNFVFESSSTRPLDLRTVDSRLLHGAYGGSHEAFVEDVQEVWINLRKTHEDDPSLVKLVVDMSKDFELQYENEVVTLLSRLHEYDTNSKSTEEVEKEIEELVNSAEIPNVPWETGICKVCGINKDDEQVLLCDTVGCNAEYHIYCLTPPLSQIPLGDWFCPTCAPPNQVTNNLPQRGPQQNLRFVDKISDQGNQLLEIAFDLEKTEYWNLNADKRILLLKALCDESLNNRCIRTHIKQLSKPFIRNKFLGKDSGGRLYWGFPGTSSHRGIIVNEITQTTPSDKWSLFQSGEEINTLVDYLTKNDPNKKKLRTSILQWKKSILQESEENGTGSRNSEDVKKSVSSKGLSTKATALLEAKFNSEPDATTESTNKPRRKKMVKWQRCECLEPLLPHRHHCMKCHRTFFTNVEFQHHKNSTCGLKYIDSGTSVTKSDSFSKDGKDLCVPESSLKPLAGKGREILKQLKINLLDMEAALPDGASRATPDCRSAWCTFVKSANTIYEMVEASIVFESMIKTEYIKNSWWWYWSSVSTAAKTTTMSALALRIYTLDASILYQMNS